MMRRRRAQIQIQELQAAEQPGSADNGVPAGNAAHGAQTGSEAPRAEDVAEHESTSGTGEVTQSSASDDTDRNQDTEYEDICYICRRPESILRER